MELRIKEICREKGLRMSDLADKMGVNQANLTASLKGNPTLSRLKDVAKILGVGLTELFEKPENRNAVDGFVEVEGETARIREAADLMKLSCRLMEIPYYGKVSDMRGAVAQFVYSAVNEDITGSLTGCLLGTEIFCIAAEEELVGETDNIVFTLTLFRRHATYTFDKLEYDFGDECDLYGDLGLVREICNLIEWQYESCDSATE